MTGQVAAQLEQLILSEGLLPGYRLPSEQELCRAFGVSRVTIREALKLLEGKGLITARPGAAGGVTVAQPSSDQVAEAIAAFAHLQQLPLRAVVEFRVEMERSAARWAALRAQPEDLERMGEILAAMAQPGIPLDRFHDLDVEFHMAIAEASKNEMFRLVMRAARLALRRAMLEGYQRIEDAAEVNARIVAEHGQILEGIRQREPDRVDALITSHISGFYTVFVAAAEAVGGGPRPEAGAQA